VGASLFNTKVTDAGLKDLTALEGLQKLNLSGTQVTDAGLKELGALKNLKILYLINTKVTGGGVAELQKALPNCGVIRN
jgi:internalin A